MCGNIARVNPTARSTPPADVAAADVAAGVAGAGTGAAAGAEGAHPTSRQLTIATTLTEAESLQVRIPGECHRRCGLVHDSVPQMPDSSPSSSHSHPACEARSLATMGIRRGYQIPNFTYGGPVADLFPTT